jgi:WD40 repeat protein
VRLWDAASGKELAVCKGHESYVTSVAFSPDGKTIVSASWDKTVRLWDAASGKELTVFKGHENYINSAAFSPDGKTIVSASGDDTVRLWDARPYVLFLDGSKATALYFTFMEGMKFFWQVKLDGLEFVPDYTPTLYAQDGYNFVYDPKFRPLLNPPAPGKSKFDQVLEWAEKQQGIVPNQSGEKQ